MFRHNVLLAAILMFLVELTAYAKDPPVQVITWPESGSPVLRFTFGKFKEIGSIGNERSFVIDTTAENLWSKMISSANFSLYLFDKNKTRIGEGYISVTNVRSKEVVKFQTTVAAAGTPVSITLVAKYLPPELGPAAPPRTVSITVNTVPQGAAASLDGTDIGITPKIVQVAVGKHTLDFKKEGFNPGSFPFEIGPNDASGGSVSYELGTSAHDTVELRDGSVVAGDLVSVVGMEVIIRVAGSEQHLTRNQVKRILLVERELPAQTSP